MVRAQKGKGKGNEKGNLYKMSQKRLRHKPKGEWKRTRKRENYLKCHKRG